MIVTLTVNPHALLITLHCCVLTLPVRVFFYVNFLPAAYLSELSCIIIARLGILLCHIEVHNEVHSEWHK